MNDSASTPGLRSHRVAALRAMVVLLVAALLSTALIGIRSGKNEDSGQMPESLAEYLLWEPLALTAFTLLDFDNNAFGIDRLKGKWTFVFFGYTFCPDICPVTLANLASTFRRLEAESIPVADVQSLFVSVDPERDTPEVLRQYVPYFSADFMAATGNKSQLDSFTRQLGAVYYREPAETGQGYHVSHNSSVFLIDPQARLYARLAVPHVPEEMASAFVAIRQYYEGDNANDDSF
ncbi:MAG: SCO family protein [Pseudomonadales bacterium]|jgi:protein SCO1/2|nr:SCO family protein [Pseudomonadales bacterium]MDP7360262.1 SCO family protein [Pseudomonadales bacterium]MDP7597230.1 SCO family protein [Pseudomonadales bacterium]HJN52406.1 SCO family protein [Pseudomonadales bacterium]|tara:strand:+ start:1574 stop:2278 length:705 start_codon:yes stop_codon:yes gene_type:complete